MVSFAIFQKVHVFIQMIRTLLCIDQFLQLWYQNEEEDIHLLAVMYFQFASFKIFLGKLDLCPGTFFPECILDYLCAALIVRHLQNYLCTLQLFLEPENIIINTYLIRG